MTLSLFARHPRYAIASGIGLLTVILLLANHQNDLHEGPSRFGFPLGGPPGEWSLSVKDKLAEAEVDYSINVGRRHAFMRKAGSNPKAIEA